MDAPGRERKMDLTERTIESKTMFQGRIITVLLDTAGPAGRGDRPAGGGAPPRGRGRFGIG